ncbi:hypothetical protein H2200_009112 [Cladophialophora chaetospira]|uniref:Alpha-1,3-mannosyltransferase CMT1 n=1 Tax=Cladophialophora chaetospira TaxID=386627 RepID=A0AA38X3Q1_9EURO|nr:hypothetical protein H2200_009112 [Cladophialophora chaetospira]
MRTSVRSTRIAVLCGFLLILVWMLYPSHTSEEKPEHLVQSRAPTIAVLPSTSIPEAHPTTIIPQPAPQADTTTWAPEQEVGVTIPTEPADTAVAAANNFPDETNLLGLNGRPKLPIERIIEEHFREPEDDGSHLDHAMLQEYVKSINDLGYPKFWRLECPGESQPGKRYEVLRRIGKEEPGIKYFFALDLFQIVNVLPRLMGSILQAIKYLGPENCAISIIEGRSTDGTYLVLHKLRHTLQELGVRYWLEQSDIDPHGEGVDRIAELSKLRNMALEPLLYNTEEFTTDPLILFVNDIAVCTDDLLELLYQHLLQNATQTCAYDWVDGGHLHYDAWVSRSMSGNTFFEIPQDMSWAFSRNMFWDEPISKAKYKKQEPLQVFSCWGGMSVLDAKPFMSGDIEFRRSYEGECYSGEPTTLASDLVKLNISRVQTVPYVAVAYNDHAGASAKGVHKYVKDWVDVDTLVERFEDDTKTTRIEWRPPPPRYRCMPSFVDCWWVDSVWDPNSSTAK